MENIKAMFDPRSVAIVGASNNPEKVGGRFLRNVLGTGYAGNVYPINPHEATVQGVKAYPSLSSLPEEADLAAIMVPARGVEPVIRECVASGVKVAIIISSGFAETGNRADEDRLVRIARDGGMRLLGPNVFGLWSASCRLNATFGPKDIVPGDIAVVTQSGALGIAMIGRTIDEGIGLSAIVSVGNKADINEVDLLRHFARDQATRAILLYIEGVKEGREMARVLTNEMPRDKPVVVLKAGRSEMGKKAAASHTGSMAGSDRVFDAAVSQTGMFRARTIEQAFDWLKAFTKCPPPKEDNAVIVTNGGGIGVLATDSCESYGVPLFNDQEILKKTFGPVTPPFGSTKNPVDITGNALGRDYKAAIQAAFDEPHIGGVVALFCETGTVGPEELAQEFISVYESNRGKKPIVYSMVGGRVANEAMDALTDKGLPVFDDLDDAVSAIGVVYAKGRQARRVEEDAPAPDFDDAAIEFVISGALSAGRTWLLADEVRAVFESAGIRMAKGGVAKTVGEAVQIANRIGYPLAMKISSEDIVHKSDAGGVALGLDNEKEALEAYEAITHSVKRRYPKARVRGIEVMEMARPGFETIVGASQDPSFGPVVMFGLGGIYVETLKDASFRLAPPTMPEVWRMMAEVRTYPLLLGVRGEARRDVGALADAIRRVGLLVDRHPRIRELDINPLRIYHQGEGALALDGRIMIGGQDA